MGQLTSKIQKQINIKNKSDQDLQLSFGDCQQLLKVTQRFLIEKEDVIKFHQIFRKMDKQGSGYIYLENMFEFLEEEMTSSLSPYITRLFQLIEKETPDNVSFVEWLPAMIVFSLWPKEKILNFVFSMIDEDHDSNISKKDLIKFLVVSRYNQKIYPFNFIKAIDLLETDRQDFRSDQISFDVFVKYQQKIPFLCYPAFRLQEQIRNLILGEKFWELQYNKIKEQESRDNAQKQYQKIQEELQIKEVQRMDKKIENWDKQFKDKKIKILTLKDIFKNCTREPYVSKDDLGVNIFDHPFQDLEKEDGKRKRRNSDIYIKKGFKIEQRIEVKKNENQESEEELPKFKQTLKKIKRIKLKGKKKVGAEMKSYLVSDQILQSNINLMNPNSEKREILKLKKKIID